MTTSSIKIRCLSAIALLAASTAAASPRLVDLDFKAQFTSKLAIHTFAPSDLAMNRQTVELEQTVKILNDWAVVLGGRVYADSAYAINDRYANEPVRQAESQDIATRDVYVQYKRPSLLVRVGSQQVVWGEAFGFYYADIVNPKDNRQFGIGDLTEQRIAVPMANLIFFLGKASLQVIAIPKPFFNQNPAIGNDFAFAFASLVPGANVSVSEPRSYPLALSNTELGARISAQVRGIDMAAFFFSYFNRGPEYSLTLIQPGGGSLSPTALFTASHSRVATLGYTGTYDWGIVVTRWEALYTHLQPVDAFGYDPNNPLAYGTFKSDLYTGVLGIDYTQIPGWRLGVQVSDKYYGQAITGALYPRNQSLVSLNLEGPAFHDQTIDLLASYVPQDGSSLLELSYLIPASSRFEIMIGANVLLGGSASQFGQFRQASTAYVQVKGYFGGG